MQDETIEPAEVWVYFIQIGSTGPVKIGHAGVVWQRMADLQVGCPWELVLRRKLSTTEPLELEARMHERFTHLRLRGEWFAYGDDLKEYLASSRTTPKKVRLHKPPAKKRLKAQVVGLDAYRIHRARGR